MQTPCRRETSHCGTSSRCQSRLADIPGVCPAGIDVHFLTLPAHFKNPFVRDWILLHGMLDTSRATCKRILSG
jgi:Diacylglycerol acyltransferase